MKIDSLKFKIAIYILTVPLYGISQVSTPSNTFFLPNDFVGWNVTAGSPPLNIKTELAQPINFYTFAGNTTFNNLRKIIYDDLSNPFNAGFVGIGIPVPNFRLTVQDDINLIPGTFPNFGYRWDGEIIMKTDVVGTNIFVGMNAGNNNISISNTYVGFNARNANNSSGGGNTFVGWNAGSGGDDTLEKAQRKVSSCNSYY